ncbi:hypothetical protein, partial [uncultured Desulfovibrio sp.]|uniref:hypothetical protein n=1 Tax=uncultured Desulfovibrio sp. TaxID=167968 RepID=UPI00261B5577
AEGFPFPPENNTAAAGKTSRKKQPAPKKKGTLPRQRPFQESKNVFQRPIASVPPLPEAGYGTPEKKGFGGGSLPPGNNQAGIRTLEHFQFEMLRISNHTACRFAEKALFFRLASGRAALCRRLAFHLFQR